MLCDHICAQSDWGTRTKRIVRQLLFIIELRCLKLLQDITLEVRCRITAQLTSEVVSIVLTALITMGVIFIQEEAMAIQFASASASFPFVFLYSLLLVSLSYSLRMTEFSVSNCAFLLAMLISRYNEYAAEWKSLKSSFQGATFQVNSSPAIMTTVSGKYFPVFDNCINSSGEGACTAAESVFYYSTLSLTGQDSVKVNIKGANGEVLLEESGVTGYYLVYTRSEMSCDPYADDSDSDSCYHKCRSMGGEYSDNRQECRVAYSLVRICLRVDGRNNTYVPDTAQLVISFSAQS